MHLSPLFFTLTSGWVSYNIFDSIRVKSLYPHESLARVRVWVRVRARVRVRVRIRVVVRVDVRVRFSITVGK
eukprot:274634-Amorphochlora_amoeboformis.AAC.1